VDLTDEWQRLPTMPVDAPERFEAAREGLISGRVDACPTACAAAGAGGNQGDDGDVPDEGD
jgi:hypothetical protein